jgi:hypothetical protein
MKNQGNHGVLVWVRLCTLVAVSMVFTAPLNAQVGDPGIFAEKTCDPDYFESLKSRAWLEAQREIVQNQNLIVKPDSVLEYSCFNKQLNVLAYYARPGGELFSGTNRWGAAPTNMRLALQRLTGDALIAYDNQNFNHDYLGGRMVGTSYTMEPVVEDPNYNCGEMDKVWKYAKCMDFIDKPHDEFFTFAEHARDDKRKLPEPCENIAPWGENIQKATGAGVPWERDHLKTYLELIYPRDANSCGHPAKSKIPTGLIVFNSTAAVSEFRENICIVPGCYYKPTSRDQGTCVRPN